MHPLAMWINGFAFGAALTTFYWLLAIRRAAKVMEPTACELCGQPSCLVRSWLGFDPIELGC